MKPLDPLDVGSSLDELRDLKDGGISMEWSSDTWEIDIEVDLKKHTGEWYAFDKNAKNCEEEKKLELDRPDDWKWAGELVRILMGNLDSAS